MLLKNLKEKYPNVKVSFNKPTLEDVCYCQVCNCEIDDGDWCEYCSPISDEELYFN